MKRIIYILIFVPIFFFNYCQQQDTQKEKSLTFERVRREISGGEVDTFIITPGKNRFLFASLFQIGVDVSVKIIDPLDSLIKEIDYLKTGPEFISFTSELEGSYKILVQPFNPMAIKGSYTIALEKNIETKNTKEELVNQLFAEFDNDYRTGAAVAVVDSGRIIYKNTFGLANREDKSPVNRSTLLNICSVGKQFTAFAIALLEQQGKLSVDDDIHKYLPAMHKFDYKITVYNLLNHSSGLREIADLLELSGTRSNGPFTKNDVFKLINKQEELNFIPGSEYLYCNTGYILLAEIIERVTGKPYIDWMAENIFEPLDMKNTFIFYTPDSLPDNVAKSYTLRNNGDYQKEQLYEGWYVGAGNIFSTVEDMAKWLINFDYPTVGDKKTIARLRENQIPFNNTNKDFYTFGRVLSNYKGLEYFWHGGGGYGYTSQVVQFPGYKFGAVVLTNFIYSGVYSRARKIADVYLSDYFTNNEPVYFDYNNPYKPVKLSDKVLSEIVGNYLEDSGVITSITRQANGLFIQTSGFGKTELYALSDSVFFIKEADIRFSFSRDESGRISKMKFFITGEETVSKKIDKVPSIPLEFYEGKYYSKELDTYYTIYASGNKLKAHNDLNGEITLTHFKNNFFKGDRWYFSSVEFIKTYSNEVSEFKITNDRARNIRFTKQ
jgi:CubicO group peptidase (beta-lactamase class C family)